MSIYENKKFIESGTVKDTMLVYPNLYQEVLEKERVPFYFKFQNTELKAPVVSIIPDRKEILNNVNYNVNSNLYRSNEIVGDEDFVFAGCSQTFGMGVDEQDVWGSIIAKNNNLTYVNLGVSGAGMRTIVNNLLAYFKVYGHPKYLRVLAPDFLRFSFIQSRENKYIKTKILTDNKAQDFRIIDTFSFPDRGMSEQYFKAPIDIQDTMPFVLIIKENMEYLDILEQYISNTDIDFKWSTWNSELRMFFNKNKESLKFKYYVEPDFMFGRYEEKLKVTKILDIKSGEFLDCHSEKSNDEKFHVGSDEYNHMGTHEHLHFAELLGINND